MSLNSYFSLEYPTPHKFSGVSKGTSALVIGSGPSTSKILEYKNVLKEKFDLVLGVNRTIRDFEDVMDYHIVMEKKPLSIVNDMYSFGYKRDLPRIINYKAIKHFPKDINIIKARREYFNGNFSLRHYKKGNKEGLLENWNKKKVEKNYGLASAIYSGTVAMQAVHFACILGCRDIYLIGTELMFDGYYDHYYKDRHYRDLVTPEFSRSKLMEVKGPEDKKVLTNSAFYRSAKFFDKVIKNHAPKAGVTFYDFSNGLISKAEKLGVNKFIGKE